MIDQTETCVRVERTADAAADGLFAVLVDPRRHVEIDGSGTLRADRDSTLIAGIGQVFSMAMHHPDLGDYTSENHIVEFEAGRRITWETTRDGKTPPGFRWGWELTPTSPSQTTVVHTYDWSRVTDQAVLDRVNFPRVSAAEMQETVNRLVAMVAA
jgi:uncharacterized protein YndB with AHSA1/START domain